MSTRNKPPKFKLSVIKKFDARQGYRRCAVPGVRSSTVGESRIPRADFWWDPDGQLVVRFTCCDENIHLAAYHFSGTQIKERDFDEFIDFVSDTLYEWVGEGIDDIPSSIFATS